MANERELIVELLNALRLAKCDAEREGSVYGSQANVVKAIKHAQRYLEKNPKT